MEGAATLLWVIAVLSAAICGYLAYRTANARHRLAPMWAVTGGFIGFVFPVIGVIFALLAYWWLGRPKEREKAGRDRL